MTNFSETEIIPFALSIIKDHPGGIDTKNLILNLRNLMKPKDEDLEILINRNDDKFSQKVRNLKSHKTLEKKGYAYFYNDKFHITDHGIEYLNQKELVNKELNLNFDLLSINILNEWPLSARTFNALKNENIIFLGDLLSYNLNDLLKLRNFGQISLNEIKDLFEKNNIKKEEINYDLDKWDDFKKKEKSKLLNQNTKETLSHQSLKNLNKSIFKNFEEFKIDYFNQKKVIIDSNFSNEQIENLIIEDIKYVLSILNERMIVFFNGRYGYKEEYKMLEELGNKYQITRERVRQLEKDLNLALSKLGKVDKSSLLKFFKKFEFVSFHKLFPKLDKNFTDTARGTGEITGDKLSSFMENYCGVNEEYFKTPERELWHFDIEKLQDIFLQVPSGVKTDYFLEKIKDYYGYNDFVAKSALKFMEEKNYIKSVDNKIFPIKMRKILEVANILIEHPNGLHWKKIQEIGNNSYTKNKWNMNRIVGDHSITMTHNKYIFLCQKGTYKLFRYCDEIINSEKIVEEFTHYLNNNNLNQCRLELAFKEIIKKKEFKKLNLYDTRAIIKKFGNEKGLYHTGKSSTETIGLNKKLQMISIKNTVKNIINNFHGEITTENLNKKLQELGFDTYAEIQLKSLVNEMAIFKLNPETYINYKEGIKLCDQEEVGKLLGKVLSNYLFLTRSFIREKLNKELGYSYSSFYYDTLCKILAKENNWYYASNYLSNKSKKIINFEDYIKENYDETLSTNENFEIISKKIGMTKINFNNVIYYSNMIFDTDWVHQND